MSSKTAQLLQFFDDDLCQDALRLTDLVAQLRELHGAICARDTEQIDTHNARLITLVGALHESSQRRRKIAQALNIAVSDDALDALISRSPAPRQPLLRAAATRVTQLMQDARAQNTRNGKLMAMHHDLINQLLSPSDDASLYQPQYF